MIYTCHDSTAGPSSLGLNFQRLELFAKRLGGVLSQASSGTEKWILVSFRNVNGPT